MNSKRKKLLGAVSLAVFLTTSCSLFFSNNSNPSSTQQKNLITKEYTISQATTIIPITNSTNQVILKNVVNKELLTLTINTGNESINEDKLRKLENLSFLNARSPASEEILVQKLYATENPLAPQEEDAFYTIDNPSLSLYYGSGEQVENGRASLSPEESVLKSWDSINERTLWLPKGNEWVICRAQKRVTGENCYVWTVTNYDDDSIITSDEKAQKIANLFDKVYQKELAVFGNKYNKTIADSLSQKYSNKPFIDSFDKISIVIYDIEDDASDNQSGGTFGYFTPANFYTAKEGDANKPIKIAPSLDVRTNEDELLFIDNHFLNKIPGSMYSTVVHEFQHMLHFVNKILKNDGKLDYKSSTWFNEMLSMTAEDLLSSSIDKFIANQSVYDIKKDSPFRRLRYLNTFYNVPGLEEWLSGDEVLYSYAKAYSFGAWLARNFGGASFIKELAQNDAVDKESIMKELKKKGYDNLTFEKLYTKYALSFVLKNGDTRDGNNAYSFNKKAENTVDGYSYPLKEINLWDTDFRVKSDLPLGPVGQKISTLKPYAHDINQFFYQKFGNPTNLFSNDIKITFTQSENSTADFYLIVRDVQQ